MSQRRDVLGMKEVLQLCITTVSAHGAEIFWSEREEFGCFFFQVFDLYPDHYWQVNVGGLVYSESIYKMICLNH